MSDELQQDTPEAEIEENPTEGQEQEVGNAESPQEVEDDGWLSVSIDDEPEEEPEHITELRRRYREKTKREKELEARLAALEAGTKPEEELPPEPELEDFDYDAAAFKQAHREWVKKSAEHEKRQEELKAIQEKATQRWEQKLTAYEEGKERLGAPDYDEAELTVSQIFEKPFPGLKVDDARMGIIKQGAKDPNALIYALGKNPAKAKELAEIEDPVEFAFSLGELSGKMKIVRGKAPPPEKKIGGAVPGVAGAMDNTLERLRAEAEKTGDYSKVHAYKRQKKA